MPSAATTVIRRFLDHFFAPSADHRDSMLPDSEFLLRSELSECVAAEFAVLVPVRAVLAGKVAFRTGLATG